MQWLFVTMSYYFPEVNHLYHVHVQLDQPDPPMSCAELNFRLLDTLPFYVRHKDLHCSCTGRARAYVDLLCFVWRA